MAGSAERIRDDLDRLADRGHGVRAFSLAAAQMLSRAVPFDGVCVLTLDPATRLPTGEVVEGGLPEHATQRMAEIEVRGLDVNPFDGLVRARRLAASLSEVTGGELDRARPGPLRRRHALPRQRAAGVARPVARSLRPGLRGAAHGEVAL